MSDSSASKTYEGSCHCGTVQFTITISPPIEDGRVVDCNCSICSINGYLLVYPKKEDVTFKKGRDNLKIYKFNTKNVEHRFCSTCGTSIDIEATESNTHMNVIAVNVRTLKDVDIDSLTLVKFDGKNKM